MTPVVEKTATGNGIEKIVTFHPIQVARVYVGMDGQRVIQKSGTLTAELKQTVEKESLYPSKSVANSRQDNIFGTDDFGFEKQSYKNSSVRVAWIDVPENETVESVTAKLANHPKARIQQTLSNKPILTREQQYAIDNGLTTIEKIAQRQIVRFSEGAKDASGADVSGKIVTDEMGRPMYRANYFRISDVADLDERTDDPADYFIPEALAMELEGIANSHY